MDLLTSWKTVPVRNYEEDDDLELNNTEISSEKSDFFSLKPEWVIFICYVCLKSFVITRTFL
jgi:hypothetical protein